MVNSVDQIVVDNIYNNEFSSFAIVNNNGKQEIYAWGLNNFGQLGLGDTNDKLVPTLLESSNLGNYLSIKELRISSSNVGMANVNTENGEQYYVWGSNSSGKLGLGDTQDRSSPTLFDTTQFGNFDYIKEISFDNQTGYNTTAHSSCIVLSTSQGIDKIYVWGNNSKGQLGLGDSTNRNTPTLFDIAQFGIYKTIKEFNIGSSSYAVMDVDGINDSLYLWGRTDEGQCTTSPSAHSLLSPLKMLWLPRFGGGKIKFVIRNYYTMYMVLIQNGIEKILSWGSNDFGQTGNGNFVTTGSVNEIPQSALGGATEIISINGIYSAFIRVKINGSIYIYVIGRNDSGQLGIGNNQNQNTPVLLSNSWLGNSLEIYDSSFNNEKYWSALSTFAYVKNSSGDDILYTWGYNGNGQLGIGSTANALRPSQVNVPNLSTSKIKSFGQTMRQSLFISLDRGNLSESYAAGYNGSGQLANGNTTQQNLLTPILPTRYTKPQPKLINTTTEISSSQALELINPNNTLNRTELDKYVDTTSFPAGATLSIDPTTTNADYKNGVLNLGITTNQYNDLLIVNPLAQPKTFNLTINGFKPITDISTNPVTTIIRDADGTNIDKIYDQVVDSTYKVINRNLLEYYFDLSSIPPNAVIHLYRTSFGNDTEATFTLTANQVYGNTGLIVNQLYVKSDLVLTLTNQINLALIISLSVVGGLLLIGSIVAIALVKRSSNKLII